MLWLLAQILFAWLQSFSLLVVAVCVVAACVAAVGVRIVRAAPIRATVVRRILLLAPFFAAAFSSQAPGSVRNGPRMWCSLGGEESVRISLRNLPGVMLSCNEGDAGLAAEVRKKMPHSRPVLNIFEHFVLGFHRGLRPVGLSCVSFHGLVLGPHLVRFETRDVPWRPHSCAAWFSKREKRKAKHKLRLDE